MDTKKDKNLFMNTKLAAKIDKVIRQLEAIREELGKEAVFPEASYALIEKRICLVCKEPILADEKPVRGVHEKCRKIQKRSDKSDEYLVEKGLLAPESVSGRKPSTRLEDRIKEVSELANTKSSRKKNN